MDVSTGSTKTYVRLSGTISILQQQQSLSLHVLSLAFLKSSAENIDNKIRVL